MLYHMCRHGGRGHADHDARLYAGGQVAKVHLIGTTGQRNVRGRQRQQKNRDNEPTYSFFITSSLKNR